MSKFKEIKIRTAIDKDIENIYRMTKEVNKMVRLHRLNFFGKLKEFQHSLEYFSNITFP